MFKKFFDSSSIDAFSDQVVADLRRHLPVADVDRTSKAIDKQRERFQALLERRVTTLAATPLNIYQKAKLGNTLQDRLEAAGYPRAFSEPLARDTVRKVAVAAARRA